MADNNEKAVDRVLVYDYKARRSMPGRRLDAYLAAKFNNFSRTYLTSLIREGKITVNDKQVKPHYELKRGDEIHVELVVYRKSTLMPENIPIEIIHEDDYILVVNKPADIIVHPARGNMSGTLVNALVYYCDSLPEGDDRVRPGIVHRLDRDTTGALVVVKDESARGWIATQFEERKVRKIYTAIVEGELELDEDIINEPIGRHRKNQEKMVIDHRHGREAITIYHVAERFRGYTLVSIQLKTGRTHQIRVHMSHIGHPIVCDVQYGARRESLYLSDLTGAEHVEGEEEPLISRQALHAYQISFNHPGTQKTETYTAPLPADMQNTIDALRQHRAK